MGFEFSWDDRKAVANLRKHGVSFAECCEVFYDPLAITYPDDGHAAGERRWLTFGASSKGQIFVVCHTDTDTGFRIISARKVDRAERKIYEQG